MAGFTPMEEEALTYDALRRVERQENTSPRLTRLEPRFWERLGEHLNTLREAFQAQQEEDPTARRTVVLADELRNTQRLAESIWSLREKKVVQAAMGAVRRREGEPSMPDHAMKEERDLYVAAMGVMVSARDEAAITDPFAQRRRDRVAAQAAKDTESKRKQPDGGAEDGTASRVEPAQSERSGPGAPPRAAHSPEAPAPVATAQRGDRGGLVPGGRTGGPGGTEGRAVVEEEGGGQGATGGPAGEGGQEDPEEGGKKKEEDEGRGGVGASGGKEMELRLVQALKAVPLFAGPDLVTYELGAGEIGTLPSKAAQLLEQRGIVRVLPGD